ncbi:MAG: flagellar basal body rod protein FlgB [Puniceicoccaceae bacterium]|nr:MAG: flagellar basal body rod protein FlgB [Puniceicoccaceae bacterium]
MLEHLLGHETYRLAKTMLDVTALRHEVLAGNLANVNSPGYKRMDLDPAFSTQLKAAVSAGDVAGAARLTAGIKAEPGGGFRPDGSNVSLDHELLELNRNALSYEFLTEYTSGSIKRLRTAITGKTA